MCKRDTSKSKSDEQQKAEIDIGNYVEEELDCSLNRNECVMISDNIHIVLDLYSEKDRIEKYLRGKSFIAESIRQFDIEVKKINPSAETYENV